MEMIVKCKFSWRTLVCKVACYEDAHALIEMLKNAKIDDDPLKKAEILMYEREEENE